MGRLTVAKIKTLRKPGRYSDGRGLYLRVAPGGSRQWIMRVTIDGKRCDLGLGPVDLVTLAEAREMAIDYLRQIRRGGDPRAERRKSSAPTFAQAAAKTLEANRVAWKGSASTARIWSRAMDMYVLPVLGSRRVDQIGRDDLVRMLSPIIADKAAMGRKVRSYVRQVFAWCEAHGHVESNLIDSIGAALPKASGNGGHHHAALPYADVPAALEAIDGTTANEAARACLRFVVLTACRTGEARGATWAEVDLDAREWRVPAERTKTGAEHRVPLSDAALDVLRRVEPLRRPSDYVFPSPTAAGRPIADSALRAVIAAAGLRATVHGFRSSFRDWCSEQTDAPHAVAEMALGHSVGSAVERSYARSDLFDRRRELMTAWAAHCAGL